MERHLFEKISQSFSGQLPPALMDQLLKLILEKLDVVPREEFDIQTAVLQKTRQKLEALEAKVKAMESDHLDREDESSI